MKQEDARSGLALRWHLSRVYEDERFVGSPGREVHVTVQPATPQLEAMIAEYGLAALPTAPADELDWWRGDDDARLEGRVLEPILVDGVRRRNAAVSPDDRSVAEADRQLAEDMVLVQLLDDPEPWRQALAAQEESGDLLNLEGLASAADCCWVDFTKAARRAAKARYKRALGERRADEGGGGEYAGKR